MNEKEHPPRVTIGHWIKLVEDFKQVSEMIIRRSEREEKRYTSRIQALEEKIRELEKSQPVHYGIVDPDYARVYTQARIIAWSYGYACVMHGSFTRDLDLLMVPWEDRAGENHEQLLKLIAAACGLRFRDGKEDVLESKPDFTDKPHGRKSCSLFFPGFDDRRWVDISFMPCKPNQEPKEVQG